MNTCRISRDFTLNIFQLAFAIYLLGSLFFSGSWESIETCLGTWSCSVYIANNKDIAPRFHTNMHFKYPNQPWTLMACKHRFCSHASRGNSSHIQAGEIVGYTTAIPLIIIILIQIPTSTGSSPIIHVEETLKKFWYTFQKQLIMITSTFDNTIRVYLWQRGSDRYT